MLFDLFRTYLTAGAILLVLSRSVMAQNVAPQSSQVLTPFGYRDKATVHQVPQGYNLNRMPDGHFRMENPSTGDHIDFPESTASAKGTRPLPDNGWITGINWFNQTGIPVSRFATSWRVPSPPPTYTGQTLFLFNGIEPGSFDTILQPVLQYGGSAAGGGTYWAVASWYVTSTTSFVSQLVQVSTGQSLTGIMRLVSHKNGEFSYSCEFKGIDGTNLSIKNIAQLMWCVETLEVYGLNQCSDFPNIPYTKLSRINIRNEGTVPAMNWTIGNNQTACGVQTTIVTDGAVNAVADIYY
jgi:hypothetical protein